MELLDSHAHITSNELQPDIHALLERAQLAGVTRIINICTDQVTLERGLELGVQGVFNAGATTPHDVDTLGEKEFHLFEKAARDGKLIAIGETGLDYHYAHSDKKTQIAFLRRYMQLATELNLPVIFHCRDAFEDLFKITDEFPKCKAALHCFTGTIGEAMQGVERGWMVSISGIVTFKKSNDLRAVAKEIPLNNMLIETDSPYLAPQSKRGKVCEPAFVKETAEVIAEMKGLSLEEFARHTTENGVAFFGLK